MIEFTEAEKVIIRNQRHIMLALADMSANAGRNLLRQRVINMERSWEWIASPNERIS